METLYSISATIVKLRWEKQYQEALEIYRRQVHGHFDAETISGNFKLAGAIIDCLKETGKVPEAIRMIEEFWKIDPAKINNSALLTNLAWTYFFAFDPQKKYNLHNSEKRAYILRSVLQYLITINQKLYGLLFFRFLENLSEKQNPNWNLIAGFLTSFPDEGFGSETATINVKIKGNDKKTELASDREKWFVWQSKALFMLAKYEDCIAHCNRAFENIEKFHHGNQHWIARRMALCYQQLGDIGKAIHELEKLSRKRSEWFIEKELAALYFQKGEHAKALSVCKQACINQGLSEYKAGLFKLMADILQATNAHGEACRFYRLVQAIRLEQNWKMPADIVQAVATCTESTENTSEGMYKLIMREWQAAAAAGQVGEAANDIYRGTGKITRILHDGSNGDGFITDTTGNGIYFRFSNCKIPYSEIQEGVMADFAAKINERSGKKVYNAIKVYRVK